MSDLFFPNNYLAVIILLTAFLTTHLTYYIYHFVSIFSFNSFHGHSSQDDEVGGCCACLLP